MNAHMKIKGALVRCMCGIFIMLFHSSFIPAFSFQAPISGNARPVIFIAKDERVRLTAESQKSRFAVVQQPFLSSECMLQTEEAIVQEVRRMYLEVQKLGLKNCTSRKKTIHVRLDSADPSLTEQAFVQTVKVCRLDKAYEVISCKFSGWEWMEDVSVYKRNGKVFFMLTRGASEAMAYEHRYYCDGNEIVVRQLDKESERHDIGKAPSVKAKLPSGDRSIYRIGDDVFHRINEVLEVAR